jgi:hypothetical protein
MPTIEELYNEKKDTGGFDNPQPKIIAGASFNNLPGGYYSGDQTPYSLGTGYAGQKDIDEEGLKKVETLNAAGNRYGAGEFGGGSSFLKNGYTDKKKYSTALTK